MGTKELKWTEHSITNIMIFTSSQLNYAYDVMGYPNQKELASASWQMDAPTIVRYWAYHIGWVEYIGW